MAPGRRHLLSAPTLPGIERLTNGLSGPECLERQLAGGDGTGLRFRFLTGYHDFNPTEHANAGPQPLIRSARALADYVLVDLGSPAGPYASCVAESADLAVVTMALERTQLAQARALLRWLDELGLSKNRRVLVGNRLRPSLLGLREAQRCLGEGIFLIVPNESDGSPMPQRGWLSSHFGQRRGGGDSQVPQSATCLCHALVRRGAMTVDTPTPACGEPTLAGPIEEACVQNLLAEAAQVLREAHAQCGEIHQTGDPEAVGHLLRSVHSYKSLMAFAGQQAQCSFAGQFEQYLKALWQKQLPLDREAQALVRQGLGALQDLHLAGCSDPPAPVTELMERFHVCLQTAVANPPALPIPPPSLGCTDVDHTAEAGSGSNWWSLRTWQSWPR